MCDRLIGKKQRCFNPWKGFRGFEAPKAFLQEPLVRCFNPWKGFRGFEAKSFSVFASLPLSCFNPWKGFRGFEAINKGRRCVTLVSFNPWKGFRGFEAIAAYEKVIAQPSFNPWKGFRGFEAPQRSPKSMAQEIVSIPERVLEALKLIIHWIIHRIETIKSFNPWKGFRGFEA